MTPPPILQLMTAVAGACIGSWVVTAAMRSARSEPSMLGRSHCDGCGVTLGYAQTVPVLSYVGAGGRCSDCGGRIDPLHPAGEITGALIGLASVMAASGWRAALLAGLGLCLLATSVIDLKTKRLSDVLTIAIAGLCAALAQTDGRLMIGAIAAVAALALLEGLRRLFQLVRRRSGLGFGDVKLIAALALWLGPATPWAIVLASLLGLGAFATIRPKDGRLAFGAPIAAAAFVIGLVREARLWPFPS